MSRAHPIALIPPALFLVAGLAFAASLSARPATALVQQQDDKAPLEVDDRIEPPLKLSGPQPAYPEAARKEGIEGTVRLRAVIDDEGRVASLETLEEASNGLTEAARDAIREWRFQPATLDGKPVRVFFEVTVNFRLDDKRKEDP